MRLRISISGHIRPSVGPSASPSHVILRTTKIMDFDDGKSSDDIINNATMSDDEVVASYGPPRSLFYICVCVCVCVFVCMCMCVCA